MTTPNQALFDQFVQLSEQQQAALAAYITKHIEQILEEAEKEYRIATGTYTINDFNEETQETIRNIENNQGLTKYDSLEEFYKDLGM